MTEEQKPEFTVVDRRRGASSPDDPDAINSGQSTSGQDEVGVDIPAEASTETGPNSPLSEPEGLPDPHFLLSLAAIRMDTKSLVKALLSIFDSHAWQAMGLVANPVTGAAQKDLASAQTAIDCVQFLLGKIDADLSDLERRELHRRLSDLRMNYVAKVREG